MVSLASVEGILIRSYSNPNLHFILTACHYLGFGAGLIIAMFSKTLVLIGGALVATLHVSLRAVPNSPKSQTDKLDEML